MLDVLDGKALLVEWSLSVDAVAKKFFHADTKPLMHIARNFLSISMRGTSLDYYVFYFYKINPWTERFNWCFQASLETGMKEAWHNRAV